MKIVNEVPTEDVDMCDICPFSKRKYTQANWQITLELFKDFNINMYICDTHLEKLKKFLENQKI